MECRTGADQPIQAAGLHAARSLGCADFEQIPPSKGRWNARVPHTESRRGTSDMRGHF